MEFERIIRLPMYGFDVYFVYTDNIAQSRENRINTLGALEEKVSDYVDGLSCYNELDPDVWIFFTPDTSTGTLGHECVHAVWRLFSWIGARFEEELFAYHLGYFLDELYKFKEESDTQITQQNGNS